MDGEDYEADEEIKRKTTVKMQLPFWYGPDNAKALDNEKTLPNDYFESYIVKEPEESENTEKPVLEGKRYFPPMVLEQKLMDLESKIQDIRDEDRIAFEIEKEVLLTVLVNSESEKSEKNFSEFSNKSFDEKKDVELRCLKLSQQVSEFQKILFHEKEKLEKERVEFDVERKSFETKFVKLSNKLSDLEKTLEKERREHDFERKESEKLKVEGFQTKCLKDDFEKERKIFQNEIKRLTKNLSGLSTDIMIEKKVKSGFQREFDLLSKERNILSNKVQELEDIIFKVEISKQASPDTMVQTPLVASTGSECSFRTASSSINTDVSSKGFDKSKGFSKDHIRPSNLFYNHSVDKSDASTSKPSENLVFKRVKMVWKVKGSTPERDAPKSSVPPPANKKNNAPKGKSFVKPNLVYSANHLIRLAQKHICCSYCGTHDFVKKEHVQYWYGTYNIPSNRTAHNKPGPKFHWVPKST